MEQHLRDLGSTELWHTSLERSRKRRTLAHDGRRRVTRKKQASGAVTAAMLLTPVLQVGGAMAGSKGKSEVAQSSPANRAIDSRTLNETLVEGATGTRVAQLQQLLGVNADGIFGPETAAAVRAFQGRAGLAADGVVGASTWRALFGASGTKGAAADSVVEGKGYQVTVSKASKAEAEILGDGGKGNGAVAKIVLTSSDAPKASGGAESRSGEPEAKPRKRRAGPTRDESRAVPEQTAPEQRAPQPAADTGQGESVACGSGRLSNPLRGGVKTSPFGPRGGRNHDGIDTGAPSGTPIFAAACGVVSTAASQGGYGNMVCIDHGSGFTTCYAHMSRFNTRQGARVDAGDVIGYVGSTGNSTGPHLHFETRLNGQARDPRPYLTGQQRAPGSRTRPAAAKASASGDASSAAARKRRAEPAASTTQTESSTAAAPSSGSGKSTAYENQGRPVQQSQAAAAPAPAPAPAEQPARVQEAAPVQQPAPVEQPASVQQPAPVEQPAPVQQPAPVEQPASVQQPAPVEQPAPVQQPAPVEQPAPAPQAEAPAPAPEPEAPQAQAPAPVAPAAEAPAPQAEAPAPAPEPETPAAPAEQPAAAAAG